MIRAEALTYSSVVEALMRGHFYSSMGPEIKELYIEGKELTSFPLNGKEGYIRVECKDEKGLYANSNAYFLSDIYFRLPLVE